MTRIFTFALMLFLFSKLTSQTFTNPPDYYRMPPKSFLQSRQILSRFTDKYINIELVEATIFHQVNLVRQQKGLGLFQYHPKLNLTARKHSEEMVQLNYFNHESPKRENATLRKRLQNGGVQWRGEVAENIALTFTKSAITDGYIPSQLARYPYDTYLLFAQTVVNHWMESTGHRENILNPRLKLMGIGICRGKYQSLDAIYTTQVFALHILN